MVTYVKIYDLPVATEATGDSELEVNQAGVTRRITVDQIADVIAEILPPPDMSDYATDEEVADAIAAIPPADWNTIANKPDFNALYVNTTGDTMTGALAGTTATLSTAIPAASNDTTVPTTAWVKANGAVMQTQSFQTGAVATGTTVMINDDTIPQITEGDQYMTLAITPKSATSKLIIEVTWFGSNSAAAAAQVVVALFQDSTANALAMGFGLSGGSSYPVGISFRHTMTSGTTSATTFRVRCGSTLAGTTTFNGTVGARTYGGVMASSIVIQEVAP